MICFFGFHKFGPPFDAHGTVSTICSRCGKIACVVPPCKHEWRIVSTQEISRMNAYGETRGVSAISRTLQCKHCGEVKEHRTNAEEGL